MGDCDRKEEQVRLVLQGHRPELLLAQGTPPGFRGCCRGERPSSASPSGDSDPRPCGRASALLPSICCPRHRQEHAPEQAAALAIALKVVAYACQLVLQHKENN